MFDIFYKDDLKSFETEYAEYILDYSLFLGSFSLLAVLYMFKCKRILNKYEKILVTTSNKPRFGYAQDKNIMQYFIQKVAKRHSIIYLDASNISAVEVLVLQNKIRKAVKLNKVLLTEQKTRILRIISWNNLNNIVELNEKLSYTQQEKTRQKVFTSRVVASAVLVLLVIVFSLVSWVNFVNKESALVYQLNSAGTYSVRCGRFYDPEFVDIEQLHDGVFVTEVLPFGFSGKEQLAEVSLPSTVKLVGDEAFSCCVNLVNISFNGEVEYIGDKAFYGCESLTSVVLQEGLEFLGEFAFANCYSLNSINIPLSLDEIEKGTFNNSFKNDFSSIVIPNTVDYIGELAFSGCNNLTCIYMEPRVSMPSDWAENWVDDNMKIEWSFVVSFNYANATGGISDTTKIIKLNSSFNWPVPTKIGYSFGGWFSDANGQGKKFTGSDGVSLNDWTDTHSLTVFANFIANENTLLFDGNLQDSGSMDNMIIRSDKSVKLPKNNFIKDGYEFIGWSTTKGGKVEYFDEESYTMGKNESYTLFAVWEANENEIVFDGNGAVSSSMNNQLARTGESLQLQANSFSRKGYTFKGWSTTKGGEVEYLDKANYTMGKNEAYTLFAVWEIITYNINIDTNGGELVEDIVTTFTVETETFTIYNTCYKKGWTFVGWLKDGKGTALESVVIEKGTAEDVYLVASYTKNTNKLIYNGNGATSGEMQDQLIKTGESATLTENEFEKNGYSFVGWSTTIDGQVDYENKSVFVIGDDSVCEIYAVWSLISYSINIDTDGGELVGTVVTTFTVETETFTISNTCNKKGWTFVGWLKDGGDAVLESVEIKKGTFANINLVASYVKNTYKIMFDGNGSTEGQVMEPIFVKTYSNVVLPLNTYKKDFYLFNGWTTIKDGQAEYLDGEEIYVGAESELTLYAAWLLKENITKIYTVEDFNKINSLTSTTNDYVLMNDLDFLNQSVYSIETLNTIFDGNGYSIKNYKGYGALFGLVSENGKLQNLDLVDAEVTARVNSEYSGGLVNVNKGNIINCFVIGGSLGGSSNNYISCGGLVACNEGQIVRSASSMDISITCSSYGRSVTVGGLVAENTSTGFISDCYSAGRFEAHHTYSSVAYRFSGACVGGFVGWNSGNIQNCYSTGQCEASTIEASLILTSIGGFAYRQYAGTITNCFTSCAGSEGFASSIDAEGSIIGWLYLNENISLDVIYRKYVDLWDNDIWLFINNEYPQLKR